MYYLRNGVYNGLFSTGKKWCLYFYKMADVYYIFIIQHMPKTQNIITNKLAYNI